MQKIRRIAEVILSAAFWLVVWAALSYAVGKEILLPSPVRVFARLFELMGTGEYDGSVFFSLARISLGFIIGTLAGCLLAYFSFASKTVEILVSPMLTVVKSTPVASFIILALVWMGKERVPVFTSVLMVLPVVYSSTLSGFRSTDKNLAGGRVCLRLRLLQKAETFAYSLCASLLSFQGLKQLSDLRGRQESPRRFCVRSKTRSASESSISRSCILSRSTLWHGR